MIKKDLLDKGALRLGLKRVQSFSNEGTRTSLGVQWLCLCASNAGGTTSTPGHRVNILLTMQQRKNISNAGTSVTNVRELHGG